MKLKKLAIELEGITINFKQVIGLHSLIWKFQLSFEGEWKNGGSNLGEAMAIAKQQVIKYAQENGYSLRSYQWANQWPIRQDEF